MYQLTTLMLCVHLFQINDLKDAGFESIHTYDDNGKSQFMDPWAFLTCFKDSKSRSRWYRSVPQLEIELHQRLFRTKSGKPTLRFFDAPTMIGYQIPTKAQETTFCRSGDIEECDEYIGYNFTPNVISNGETRKSIVSGKYGGRGLFAVRDIPKYSLMSMNMSVHSFHVLPSTWSVIEQLNQWADDDEMDFVEDEMSSLVAFTEGYGYKATLLVSKIIIPPRHPCF